MKFVFALLVLLAPAFAQHSPEFLSAEKKLAAMKAFEQNPSKGGLVTVLTDPEMNAYFNEGGIKWSDGVSDVRIEDQPSAINGSAQVDFDQVTAKRQSNNPLMMLFTGVHTVRVTAQASAVNGRATIHVASVSLDGLEIPRKALEFFIQKYLQPKYPEVDLDMVIAAPHRVNSATAGDGQITFAQR
jgi:hypothetical protein